MKENYFFLTRFSANSSLVVLASHGQELQLRRRPARRKPPSEIKRGKTTCTAAGLDVDLILSVLADLLVNVVVVVAATAESGGRGVVGERRMRKVRVEEAGDVLGEQRRGWGERRRREAELGRRRRRRRSQGHGKRRAEGRRIRKGVAFRGPADNGQYSVTRAARIDRYYQCERVLKESKLCLSVGLRRFQP